MRGLKKETASDPEGNSDRRKCPPERDRREL